jgi:hypothetical protein
MFPRESTTQPSEQVPAGILRRVRDPKISIPSGIDVAIPKITIPTKEVSRFRAKPAHPLANRKSSPEIIFQRPNARTIPSPDAITTPRREKFFV